MCVCMYVCVCVCACVRAYIFIYLYGCMYVCMYAHISVLVARVLHAELTLYDSRDHCIRISKVWSNQPICRRKVPFSVEKAKGWKIFRLVTLSRA